MSRGPNWTREEYEHVLDLLSRGYTKPAIATMIGKTIVQVRHKISYESMTEERREQIRLRVNNSRRRAASQKPQMAPRGPSKSAIFEPCPREVFDERARRHAIDYPNFTAAFFGDPKPGFSALDKKQGVA